MESSSVVRRTANYKPSIWNDAYIQTLNSPYLGKRFMERAEQLKGEVKILLEKTDDLIEQIQVVDILQRLGIYYHFTEYIDQVFKNVYRDETCNENLHDAALRFRLLRQDGYTISPAEVLRNFTNERREFKTSLCNETKGLISLYEASYLLMEGETILELAQDFSAYHLKQKLNQNINKNIAEEIAHALELPFHWKMPRLESKWFISAYEKRQDMNLLLLEFAKLDFNMVQAMYQDELKELSRWYTKTQLAERLNFSRDRLAECFLWTIGFTYEPYFRYCRINLGKVAVLITIIDDIFDVYGTLDELEVFTDVVDRWDIKGVDKLPEYMKICFLALFNMVNEMAYDVYKDRGFNIIPHATSRWAELCKTYLVEAKWYHSGYKPSLDEFLDNGWVSFTGPLNITHAYLCMASNTLKDKPLEDIQKHPEIIKWISLIGRLADDLGTSTDELKRGDTPKSIQCYMHDTGCREEDSREYIKNLIGLTWKKINKDTMMNNEYSRDFIRASMNFARISQCMYQYGDGYGNPNESKAWIMSLVVEPISLEYS